MMIEQIGPYQVKREIGRGGMGVVYLARDDRLDREVAIKCLPAELANDPVRLERFEREAKTLAQLNHTNVAAIYGVEEQDGQKYLILEYVEGETLGDRLDRGALPLDDALEIAIEIAAGIEAAHDAGVIHRDLKPDNIKITPEGKVKVLDFGLARTDEHASSSITDGPTLTTPRSPTIPGAILGTAPYMSPEQARGRKVDKRTDIWSFGVILYEMLTGASPFVGETATDSIGAVLHKAVDLGALPPETPASVHHVLARCLERDRNLRYRDIGDVRIELERPEAAPAGAGPDRRHSSWAVAAAIVLIAIVGLASWFAGRSSAPVEPRLVARFDIYSRETDRNRPWAYRGPVISPDATRVALLLDDAIYMRDLAEFEPRLLPGTEGASHVFWSPDSQWLGFTLPEEGIYKTPAIGGGVTRIWAGEPSIWLPPVWVERDRILFQDGPVTIKEVSPRGGVARVVLERDPETMNDFHGFLAIPGTDVLILNRHDSSGDKVIEATDGRRSVDLFQIEGFGGSMATAWSPTGHILYAAGESRNDIWALPFSPATLAQTGDQFLAIEGMSSPSVAADGTIAALRGEMPTFSNDTRGEFVFVDGEGAAEHIGYSGEPESGRAYSALLSPDESYIAFARRGEDRTTELWIHEIERGINTRIASPESDGEGDSSPISPMPVAWSPDGSRLAVRYARGDRYRSSATLRIIAADGSGPTDEPIEGFPVFISRDWSTALLVRNGLIDPTIVSVDLRDGKTTELPELNAMDDVDSFSLCPSPDGQHILFAQGSIGQGELYCSRFPDMTGRNRVSTHGGGSGFWSRDGSTVYYAEPVEGRTVTWMKVQVNREPLLRFGLPEPVFGDSDEWRELSISLAETSDPEKMFAVRSVGGDDEEGTPGPVTISIIRNWYEEFRRQ